MGKESGSRLTGQKTEIKMSKSGNKGMESLIRVITDLMIASNKAGLTFELKLPQIVVIGSESSGKSSVLESIVGRDFLPRGVGMVTRCPIVLQLTRTNGEKAYGEFSDEKGKFYYDFDDIRKEIQNQTDFIAGEGKGISAHPINLQIFSPHVLDVTLVDLPGLVNVAVTGLPGDIPNQIEFLVKKYISEENSLILAVTQANIALAGSAALKLAQEVDPDGNRTIGVITKLDLDDGTNDVLDVLENRMFPLRRGYVGVVNRSQKDIDSGKTIQAALKSEADFFANHEKCRHMADRCGTLYQQQVLNRELTEHIRESMPTLQEQLRKKISEWKNEVDRYKKSHSTDPSEMRRMIIIALQNFVSDFNDDIGTFGPRTIETKKLSNGAEINEIFHERLSEEIGGDEYFDLTLDGMNIMVRNIHGYRIGSYPSLQAFELYTQEQISELKKPIALCIDLVIDILISSVRKCAQNIIYPNLRELWTNMVFEYIADNTNSFRESILSLVDIEHSYLNTNQMDSNKKRVNLSREDDFQNNHTNKMHPRVEEMRSDIISYMAHVKKNMNDMIPKAITFDIIKKLKDYIKINLLDYSMGIPREDYENLLKMEEKEEAQYKKASNMLEACTAALNTINKLSKETHEIVAGDGKNKKQRS